MSSITRWILLAIAVASLAAASAGGLALSTYSLDHATARFVPGEGPDVNDLHLRGPYDRLAVRYDVCVTDPDGSLGIGGVGFGRLPLFGDLLESASWFPSSGTVDDIPLETHVRLTTRFGPSGAVAMPRPEDEARVGTYVIVTSDESWPERLGKEAPALGR